MRPCDIVYAFYSCTWTCSWCAKLGYLYSTCLNLENMETSKDGYFLEMYVLSKQTHEMIITRIVFTIINNITLEFTE